MAIQLSQDAFGRQEDRVSHASSIPMADGAAKAVFISYAHADNEGGVCWHEARAYCAWLSAQTGTSFRLPSEAEWEAAARGREGRRYAYPGEFDPALCNTFESHIRRTTPVGLFAEGNTPEGIADLTGNVWDWTGSAYLDYPYEVGREREDPSVEAKYRVVRGGSWDDDRADARAACRSRNNPGLRYYVIGFRVVRGFAPVP